MEDRTAPSIDGQSQSTGGLHCEAKSWQCASFRKCFFVLQINLDYYEPGCYFPPPGVSKQWHRRAGAEVGRGSDSRDCVFVFSFFLVWRIDRTRDRGVPKTQHISSMHNSLTVLVLTKCSQTWMSSYCQTGFGLAGLLGTEGGAVWTAAGQGATHWSIARLLIPAGLSETVLLAWKVLLCSCRPWSARRITGGASVLCQAWLYGGRRAAIPEHLAGLAWTWKVSVSSTCCGEWWSITSALAGKFCKFRLASYRFLLMPWRTYTCSLDSITKETQFFHLKTLALTINITRNPDQLWWKKNCL